MASVRIPPTAKKVCFKFRVKPFPGSGAKVNSKKNRQTFHQGEGFCGIFMVIEGLNAGIVECLNLVNQHKGG